MLIRYDEELLFSKIEDMICRAQKTYLPQYSFFCDEREVELITSFLKNKKGFNYLFWGGYEDARRKILCVHSELYSIQTEDFPINCIGFKYRKSEILTHRDFLGTLMAVQIKRNCIGDIVVNQGYTLVLAYKTISDCVMSEISKVKNCGVQLDYDTKTTIVNDQQYQLIKGSVASLRIDSILTLITGKSREKTSELIRKIGVEINHIPVFDVSSNIKQGDVFTLRGYGKFFLESLEGTSKKGRLHINIKKYL